MHHVSKSIVLITTTFLTACAFAADVPTATELIKQFDRLEPKPIGVKPNDPASIEAFKAKVADAANQRAEIAKTFLENYSAQPRSIPMLLALLQSSEYLKVENAIEYCRAFAEKNPKSPAAPEALATVALYSAYHGINLDEGMAMIDAYVKSAPPAQGKTRKPDLLIELYLRARDANPTKRVELLQSLVKEFPGSPAARKAKQQLVYLEKLGKPFTMSFVDVLTKKKITTADYKGKVLIVDFWSVGMPSPGDHVSRNKEIEAKYKDQGVAFVGISMDIGPAGQKAMLEFVKQHEITWPQYFQGPSATYSTACGVMTTPAQLVVDADGNLVTYDGLGQLEKLIPELAAKRDANKSKQ